jgi:hypothetical protein
LNLYQNQIFCLLGHNGNVKAISLSFSFHRCLS